MLQLCFSLFDELAPDNTVWCMQVVSQWYWFPLSSPAKLCRMILLVSETYGTSMYCSLCDRYAGDSAIAAVTFEYYTCTISKQPVKVSKHQTNHVWSTMFLLLNTGGLFPKDHNMLDGIYSYDCAGGALSSFFFLDIYKQLVIFLGHPRVVSYCVGLVIPIATKVNNPRTRLKIELGVFLKNDTVRIKFQENDTVWKVLGEWYCLKSIVIPNHSFK